jgi:hypothetical protein
MLGLSREDEARLRKLNTPQKIQDFLDALPFNFEEGGDTLYSPVRVLRERKAHCLEGALFAAAAFWVHGGEPFVLDLVPRKDDDMHVVAPFRYNGYWGAVSKTNHAVLRYRDPIYKTIRELVLSYFHEYFLNTTGEKTLRFYSKPYNLRKLGSTWVTSPTDVWAIDAALDAIPHFPFLPHGTDRQLRKALPIERRAGALIEWNPPRRRR